MAPTEPDSPRVHIETRDLRVHYGEVEALRGVSLNAYHGEILGLIGPAGSGKTSLLRTLNRLNDLEPAFRFDGAVRLGGEDIYAEDVDPCTVRRRLAMVFALPTPLPKSVFENIAYGQRVLGLRDKRRLFEIVEGALVDAALWEEVKDRLHEPALRLSGGQQQRLCIARAIAQQPEALLLDEPCSGLDPISTHKIEEALQQLKARYSILLVSHNVQQAARASDRTAFLLGGELIEHAPTEQVFSAPRDQRTADYITGVFG